jgi:eukaryotic-like serine/threonine-protein kinase
LIKPDPVSGNVSWLGKRVHLQRKDLEVLALLASNPGAVIARSIFITVVWNGNDLVGDRGVSDKIFSLRRALQDHDESQPIIRTIPRRGYQLSQPAVQPVVLKQPVFAPGNTIAGSPGWRLQRRLSESERSESWLAQSSDGNTAPQVFSFCRSEVHLRRLQRETTLLRYLSESLGERQDFALVRDWQLQEPPYFLARDYCTHGSLTAWANAVGGLAAQSLPQRTALMLALAAAVASMHEIGVVHGQLSSASILLDDGDPATGPQLKLSAFDLGVLRDHSKLAALKITAAGLSFVEGTQAPRMADDIYALGALLLQLAVGDLSAEPGDAWLARVPKTEWRNLISACLDSESKRPSATMVHQLLLGRKPGGRKSAVGKSRSSKTKPSFRPRRRAR